MQYTSEGEMPKQDEKVAKLEWELTGMYAIVVAILEKSGPVTVKQGRLHEIIQEGRVAEATYDAEKQEITYTTI